MKNELLQAIRDGELTPREYALIQEWSFDASDRSFYLNRWWDKFYTFSCTALPRDKRYNFFLDHSQFSKDIPFVNKCRAEIGMCTLEHQARMKKFAEENGLIIKFGFQAAF